MIKQLKLGALIAALVASAGAMAHDKPGYTESQESGSVVRNAFGECWQNDYFEEGMRLPECGGKVATPAPAPTPAQPQYSEVVIPLKAQFLFGFDKYNLRPEAKTTLNQLADQIGNAQGIETIRVEGHTDFMGAESYNQKLSERRANTVAKYLVARGVDQGKITTVGFGETQQTMEQECRAKVNNMGKASKAKKRSALIACIEPDRRVDVRIRSVEKRRVN